MKVSLNPISSRQRSDDRPSLPAGTFSWSSSRHLCHTSARKSQVSLDLPLDSFSRVQWLFSSISDLPGNAYAVPPGNANE